MSTLTPAPELLARHVVAREHARHESEGLKTMRVVLATVGTRGDVQPFVAIAQALRKRGHSAVVACPATFADFVGKHGIEHAALGEDMHALMVSGGSTIQRSIAGMQKYFTEQLVVQAPRLVELATGADAIVSTAMAWSGASAAEKLGLPALSIFPSTAALRSRAHPPPLFPFFGLPRFLYGLLWSMTDSIQDRLMGGPLSAARAAIGLPPIASFNRHLFGDVPAVLAVDETLLPPDPAWGDRWPYAGFLFALDPTPLEPGLEVFLSDGEPPVCIGFGSMAGDSADRAGRAILGALRITGRRAVVLGGSAKLFEATGGAGIVPSNLFVAREAPHSGLFPRVSCVVHHGGSGTTAAAARAGAAQVILPMMLDQFHHQHHAVRAGIAPRAPKMAKVTEASLATAIEAALALPAAPRQALAERLRKSDAGAFIVARLEERVASRGH